MLCKKYNSILVDFIRDDEHLLDAGSGLSVIDILIINAYTDKVQQTLFAPQVDVIRGVLFDLFAVTENDPGSKSYDLNRMLASLG